MTSEQIHWGITDREFHQFGDTYRLGFKDADIDMWFSNAYSVCEIGPGGGSAIELLNTREVDIHLCEPVLRIDQDTSKLIVPTSDKYYLNLRGRIDRLGLEVNSYGCFAHELGSICPGKFDILFAVGVNFQNLQQSRESLNGSMYSLLKSLKSENHSRLVFEVGKQGKVYSSLNRALGRISMIDFCEKQGLRYAISDTVDKPIKAISVFKN